MKLLIAALLAVFSTNVLAEWTRVGGNDTKTTYADLSTIRKSGDRVKMWELLDFKVVQTVNGQRFLSSVIFAEYDCKEETSRVLAFNWYSKNIGAGEVVHNSGTLHGEPQPVSPVSIVNSLLKLACGK